MNMFVQMMAGMATGAVLAGALFLVPVLEVSVDYEAPVKERAVASVMEVMRCVKVEPLPSHGYQTMAVSFEEAVEIEKTAQRVLQGGCADMSQATMLIDRVRPVAVVRVITVEDRERAARALKFLKL